MKKHFLLIALSLFVSLHSFAAVLHFYSNPKVPQPLFHVTLEYKSFIYEADTRVGGRKFPVLHMPLKGDIQIEIADELVNEDALDSQMGLPFDYEFIWNNNKTYCSKLVGIALSMQPRPMSFAGTHYVKHYPEWIHRNDPGISPDDIYEFGLNNALKVIRKNH